MIVHRNELNPMENRWIFRRTQLSQAVAQGGDSGAGSLEREVVDRRLWLLFRNVDTAL